MDDKDAGLLICNGVMDYSPKKIKHLSYIGIIKYSLKIQVKNNRYSSCHINNSYPFPIGYFYCEW